MKRSLIVITLLLVTLAAVFGPGLYRDLTISLKVDVPEGPVVEIVKTDILPDTDTLKKLEKQLEAAGLSKVRGYWNNNSSAATRRK